MLSVVVVYFWYQVSIDQDGKPTQSNPINWSEPPMAVEIVEPYIIGVLPKYVVLDVWCVCMWCDVYHVIHRGVEVRAFEQKAVVQVLRTNDVKLLASHK